MNNGTDRRQVSSTPLYTEPSPLAGTASPILSRYRWLAGRWLAGGLAATLWFTLVYGLPLNSATGPSLILAAATVFVIAHPVGFKRRLDVAERAIQALRKDAPSVEGVSRR